MERAGSCVKCQALSVGGNCFLKRAVRHNISNGWASMSQLMWCGRARTTSQSSSKFTLDRFGRYAYDCWLCCILRIRHQMSHTLSFCLSFWFCSMPFARYPKSHHKANGTIKHSPKYQNTRNRGGFDPRKLQYAGVGRHRHTHTYAPSACKKKKTCQHKETI